VDQKLLPAVKALADPNRIRVAAAVVGIRRGVART
jgi:hypothetical protein